MQLRTRVTPLTCNKSTCGFWVMQLCAWMQPTHAGPAASHESLNSQLGCSSRQRIDPMTEPTVCTDQDVLRWCGTT